MTMPQYTKAQWRALGRFNVDPKDAEQMGLLSQLLHIGQGRIYEAIKAVGPRIADIQKYLQDNPVTVKPRRWRRR